MARGDRESPSGRLRGRCGLNRYDGKAEGDFMALQSLLDKNELQRLQDEFCRVAGVSAYCLDHGGTKLTRISGDDRYLHSMQERSAFERVQGSQSLEDLAVEDLDGGGQVAALAIRARGEKELYWVVCRPENMTESAYGDALDLLRDASVSFLQGKIQSFSAEAENIRSLSERQKMDRSVRMVTATAGIVQLLESREPIEKIMNDWLGMVGNYLGLDTAQIFKLQDDEKYMDVICEWRGENQPTIFDRTSGIRTYSILRAQQSAIVNTDEIVRPEYREIYDRGIRAVMLFPIRPQEGSRGMMLSLNFRRSHVFDEEEKRFASDAVKVLQNILVRRIQKNSLISSYASLEEVLDNVNVCIYVQDKKNNKPLFANRMLQEAFGEELRNGAFQMFLEKKQETVRRMEEQGQRNPFLDREFYYEEKDRWYDITDTEIRWVDGSMVRLYSLHDITDKKRYQGRIEQQAYTDFLTGLYNRMCCERDLAVQVDAAKKQGKIGALLYLDLDDFKHINDGLGHQYGDALLKAISHAFQRIPGIERTCYRMGGDEFVIVVPPESYEEFDRILESIRKIFSKPWFLKDADYYCTMSMGVVTFPNHGESVPELVKKADLAMYEAKKGGKNRIAFYSDDINSSDRRRLDMEKNMRDAASEGYQEFEVYYQPIIDVQDGQTKCSGAEALVRWNSENLGFVTPMEFIPLAEYLGLINPIGNHVLLHACRNCKEWNDKGFDYKVNVNLSVVQLLQPDIVEVIDSALKESGLLPDRLTLEVTESLAINDMERMKRILGRIKELGVYLALDDFGTGYSSLNHIREIPFDVIKVDQSFVKDLAEDAYSQSFIKLVGELAETIGVSICVEGIETDRQYKVLKGMKVKYIQGYFFDRPMPLNSFEEKYCAGPDDAWKAPREITAGKKREAGPEQAGVREMQETGPGAGELRAADRSQEKPASPRAGRKTGKTGKTENQVKEADPVRAEGKGTLGKEKGSEKQGASEKGIGKASDKGSEMSTKSEKIIDINRRK